MDWKHILSQAHDDWDDDKKEEIFDELIYMDSSTKFDKNSYKKLFRLAQTILKYKGEQISSLISDLEAKDEQGSPESLINELDKQKKIIEKHEFDRMQYKNKIKELTEETVVLQKRLQESSHFGSENEDSPDALSEIDRQQELLGNINMKNKYIRRLLRDIEEVELKSSDQLELIKDLKLNLNDATVNITSLTSKLQDSNSSMEQLDGLIQLLNKRIFDLDEQVKGFEDERIERESEMEKFAAQLEERVSYYKGILDENQQELDVLKKKYSEVVSEVPGYDIDDERGELKKLLESIKERDVVISTFEEKICQLTTELYDSTKIINQLSNEKESYIKSLMKDKNDDCCSNTKILLEKSNIRCKELQEMVEIAESENSLKSKQAFEAIETLRSYENNEDGLSDALKKIHKLQENLHQRDKQIHDLVVELNSANEIMAENSILRKKLGIPDDEIIETKKYFAKQRKYAKQNERLLIKLRASEELRLQLKIEKNDLRRKINALQNPNDGNLTIDEDSLDKHSIENQSVPKEIKYCDHCSAEYNVYDSIRFCRSCIVKQNSNLCENCLQNFKISSNENIEHIKKIAKMEIDHQNIVEENDTLRVGMHEILEKLRDFDSSIEKCTINPNTLEKLLYILSSKHPNNSESLNGLSNHHPDEQSEIRRQSINDQLHNQEAEIERLKSLVIDLSNHNDRLEVESEQTLTLKNQYNELMQTFESSGDEKDQLLASSLKRCNEIELNLKICDRKIDFLKNENDNLINNLKTLKFDQIKLMTDLKVEIMENNNHVENTSLSTAIVNDEDSEKFESIFLEFQKIKLELNALCCNMLKNVQNLDSDNLLQIDLTAVSHITLLENSLSTTFITRHEYKDMQNQIQKLQNEVQKLRTSELTLKELAKITQSQLLSQQQLIAKFSDDEISARHLIVDLQSQSNEKYLLTKTQTELNVAKENYVLLKIDLEKSKNELAEISSKLSEKDLMIKDLKENFQQSQENNILKIRYLKKTLTDLAQQFGPLTPIYSIVDFIKHYVALLNLKKSYEQKSEDLAKKNIPEMDIQQIIEKLQGGLQVSKSEIENRIDVIKYKSSCEYLKQQLNLQENATKDLQSELDKLKIQEVNKQQHWNTMQMLFSDKKPENVFPIQQSPQKSSEFSHKAVQVQFETRDGSTNTDQVTIENTEHKIESSINLPIMQSVDTEPMSIDYQQRSLDSQLKQAMILASTRSSLLLEAESQLSEAQGRIKVLEKNLEDRDKLLKQKPEVKEKTEEPRSGHNILSVTISTLQNLLLEKDTTLSKYQELLKVERQQHSKDYDELIVDVRTLKKTIDECEEKLVEKEKIGANFKEALLEAQKSLLELSVTPKVTEVPSYESDSRTIELQTLKLSIKDLENDNNRLQLLIKELLAKEKVHESHMKEKEHAIKELNQKKKSNADSLDSISENLVVTREIEQMREILDEKDKHIQDLTETLNQFHDDQQKYMSDSVLNSAEQMTQMGADLTRSEATNRVFKTQLDALKRQITSITQRDKQARDMIKTLKNQLIHRPVISLKGDTRTISQREENQARKIQQLNGELMDLKDELRRQVNINENRRAKNAAELQLWDKQKRSQEIAEKLKSKLTEKEIDFERLKANFIMAKNTITRYEKDRMNIEHRMKSGRHFAGYCANCNQLHGGKYTPAETPDSYATTTTTTANSETGSIADLALNDNNRELIEVFKARIESQQRRIISMELDGKGSNAVAVEMERLHDRVQSVESQNIRLEAKNIQLQLDNDLLKQNENDERTKRQLKHLEDYVLVLKDELAQCHASTICKNCKASGDSSATGHSVHQMEQTILTLRRVIEKLKAENKYMKDSKPSTSSSYQKDDIAQKYEKLKLECERLQKIHHETLEKMAAIQVELELQQANSNLTSCPHCNNPNLSGQEESAVSIRDQLQQKSQLLEKAKILLTRAAAKERHLKEQIDYLKRRCCELQNVPVIEETSE